MTSRPPRIVVIQDRPLATERWSQHLTSACAEMTPAIAIETFDFRHPLKKFFDSLEKSGAAFDWMLTDLTIDTDDSTPPEQSRGIQLIEGLVQRQLFLRYRKPSDADRGVRCIAVCSVLIERGRVTDKKLSERLANLGVRGSSLFARDEDRRGAEHIRDELIASNLLRGAAAQ